MNREALADAAARLGHAPPHKGRLVPASVDAFGQMAVDALIAFVFADVAPLQGAAGLIDWYLCGTITHAMRGGMFCGALRERLLVPTFGRLRPRQVLVMGLGPLLDCDGEALRRLGEQTANICREAQWVRVTGCLPAAEPNATQGRRTHAEFCGDTLQTTMAASVAQVSVPMWLTPPEVDV